MVLWFWAYGRGFKAYGKGCGVRYGTRALTGLMRLDSSEALRPSQKS